MICWLDKGPLLNSVKIVTTTDPRGINCLKNHSDDPFDCMDFISTTLKFVGNSTIKEFGESDRVLRRKKDNKESRKFREAGNRLFQSKPDNTRAIEGSFELYSKSIAFAIPNSQEVAMGYANRSALLYKVNRPKECLGDIERVQNSNYPEELMPKLKIRQAECFSMLANRSRIQAKFWLNKVPANDPNWRKMKRDLKGYSAKDYKSTFDQESVLPKVKSPRVDIPCSSDAIEIEYSDGPSEEKFVATRDIGVGEVLVVEKPYLAYCLEANHYFYCEFCLQSFWNGIPCDNCPNTMYCSEKCKSLAWREYHSLECSVLNLMLHYGTVKAWTSWTVVTASFKLFIKFYKEAGGLDALKERIGEFQKHYDGKWKSEWFVNQTMESVLILKYKFREIMSNEYETMTANAIHTLFHIATNTNLLGVQYNRNCMSDEDIVLLLSNNKDAQFVAGLLLKLSILARHNNTIATERIPMMAQRNNRGFLMSPVLQTITHSCYFNTMLQFVGEHVILHAITPIKKGEEILSSSDSWVVIPKEKRLLELIKREGTNKCNCRACVENWPTFEHLDNYKIRAKSPASRSILRKVLQPLSSVYQVVVERNEHFKDYDKILNSLKEMLEAIYNHVNLPCYEQGMILHAIAQFYHRTGMNAKMTTRYILRFMISFYTYYLFLYIPILVPALKRDGINNPWFTSN